MQWARVEADGTIRLRCRWDGLIGTVTNVHTGGYSIHITAIVATIHNKLGWAHGHNRWSSLPPHDCKAPRTRMAIIHGRLLATLVEEPLDFVGEAAAEPDGVVAVAGAVVVESVAVDDCDDIAVVVFACAAVVLEESALCVGTREVEVAVTIPDTVSPAPVEKASTISGYSDVE